MRQLILHCLNWILEGDERDEKMKKREDDEKNEEWQDNQIGDEGAKALSESSKINSSLTQLFVMKR